jgi:N-ethylmaleimide reductase
MEQIAMPTLFDPLKLGNLVLPNRIVLAPMTRSRARANGVINESAVTYYRQRASAGMIITEGVNIGPMSKAFERTPGLWTDEQVEGWRPVVAGIHKAGGQVVAQLWHGGRASARGLLGGLEPLSPSAVNDDLAALQVWGLLANGAYVKIAATPSRAMTIQDIRDMVVQYRTAAANAIRAGFDGVEIHGANGYLIHQFLSSTINRRTDDYGGDVAGRSRFLREVIGAVAEVMPLSRVGLRLSPYAAYNNVRDPDPEATYGYLARWVDGAGLAYLHLADTNAWGGAPDLDKMIALVHPHYRGPLIVGAGITPEHAREIVESGSADGVAFGRLFIANPDLVRRIRLNGPYNPVRDIGIYGGTDVGYTDYLPLQNVGTASRAA